MCSFLEIGMTPKFRIESMARVVLRYGVGSWQRGVKWCETENCSEPFTPWCLIEFCSLSFDKTSFPHSWIKECLEQGHMSQCFFLLIVLFMFSLTFKDIFIVNVYVKLFLVIRPFFPLLSPATTIDYLDFPITSKYKWASSIKQQHNTVGKIPSSYFKEIKVLAPSMYLGSML